MDTTAVLPPSPGKPEAPTGEEFRPGLPPAGPRAGDATPTLPVETVRALSRIDPWRSTAAVLWSFGLIALAVSAGVLWWHPVTVALLLVIMAGLQQSLFVLAHDAAHYRLYEARWLNDAVGGLCGGLVGIPMAAYRLVHRLHHNHLYAPIDPDLPLIAGYPRGPRYLLGKLGRDLLGLTAWKTYAYFWGNPVAHSAAEARQRPLGDTSPRLRRAALRNRNAVIAGQVLLAAGMVAQGWGVEYALLWMLPALTTLQALLRLRAVLEHGAAPDTTTPLRAARTNLAPAWLRWWLFSHHVNYHVEHHLYPSIPHYRLPAAHRALRESGALAQAEVVPVGAGLRAVLGPAPERSAAASRA